MRVLIAMDDSECSTTALDSVLEREWPAGTAFHVLSVVEPFHPEYAGWQTGYLPLAVEAQQDRLDSLRKLARQAALLLQERFGSEHVSADVVEGFAKEAIIDTARSWPADVIIMGSHQRSGFERLFLGSVSLSVLSAAPCTVEIIKPEMRKAS